MREITVRQAEILLFIENFIAENQYSPSIREIGEHFLMSAKGAHDHVISLIKKGCLTMQYNKPRTLRINRKKEGVGV